MALPIRVDGGKIRVEVNLASRDDVELPTAIARPAIRFNFEPGFKLIEDLVAAIIARLVLK
jgi:hypothetical protein